MTSDEGSGGQVEDQTAIHLLVEVEVEVVEVALWVAKLGLLGSALQQTIAATGEFVPLRYTDSPEDPFIAAEQPLVLTGTSPDRATAITLTDLNRMSSAWQFSESSFR
jgi:hypothetical protein